MSQVDPQKVEELQMLLLKNPRSPAFANLAEAYWKMGMLEEALEVTSKGVRHNPEYVSGLVAHGKILFELKDYKDAIRVLTKAHLLNPENLLAIRLLAHCFVKTKEHLEALSLFKKLLMLKPNDASAQKFVKDWEFLENVDDDLTDRSFELNDYGHWIAKLPNEHQVLHLIDSFMNRGENQNAMDVVDMALAHRGETPGVRKRKDLLREVMDEESESVSETEENPALYFLRKKRNLYEKWLHRIEELKAQNSQQT